MAADNDDLLLQCSTLYCLIILIPCRRQSVFFVSIQNRCTNKMKWSFTGTFASRNWGSSACCQRSPLFMNHDHFTTITETITADRRLFTLHSPRRLAPAGCSQQMNLPVAPVTHCRQGRLWLAQHDSTSLCDTYNTRRMSRLFILLFSVLFSYLRVISTSVSFSTPDICGLRCKSSSQCLVHLRLLRQFINVNTVVCTVGLGRVNDVIFSQ